MKIHKYWIVIAHIYASILNLATTCCSICTANLFYFLCLIKLISHHIT